MKSAKKIALWLIDEYPPFYSINEEELIKNIQENIIDGWIPYIEWYNKTHRIKMSLPTDPQDFIERVLHKSLMKCEIKPPKIGQDIRDYLEEAVNNGN